jgi:hypothetical protein
MAKIKMGLNRMVLTDKIQLARQIVVKMTGNAAFTTPVPALVAVGGVATTAESAFNDAQGAAATAKQKTAAQNVAEAALDSVLTQLASYVENTSNGDEVKILSAGMGVRAERTAPTIPVQVLDLAATVGDNDGEIDLAWDPCEGAKSYSIDLSTVSGTGPWTNGRVVTKSSATVPGLTSGGRVWFRVAAIGAAGQGPWSDPATKIVP